MDQAQGLYTQELTPPVRDQGSFRDPSGFVFYVGDEVYRAIDADCSSLMSKLERSGLLDELTRSNRLIPTRVVRTNEAVSEILRANAPAAAAFLQHERVPFVSYPYEWSPSMLADAAACCLDLQLVLVDRGYSLKDASAYNIQFIDARPVFIDVPSIEEVRRRDVWTALDQFYRMFLYPLLLSRCGRGGGREYFLSHLDGAPVDETYRRFGFIGAIRRALLDLWLPHQLQKLLPGDSSQLRRKVERECDDPRSLVINLKRLLRKVRRIGANAPASSRWVDYVSANSYDDAEMLRKEEFVGELLKTHQIRRVLDLGCNTGRFSELAESHGATVVAVDADVACIDKLYRRSRDHHRSILPLVVDVANPSPGIGFRNLERASFMDRASFDCVFALALVHHLLVTARLPLKAIRDLLADLTSEYLVIEYIEPEDPMFVSVLGARENIYHDLTLDGFMEVFEKRFEIFSHAPITPHRTLFTFRKRA